MTDLVLNTESQDYFICPLLGLRLNTLNNLFKKKEVGDVGK